MKKFFNYIKSVFRHRKKIMKMCFKAGLFWRGIFHDLSKYSIRELFYGAKYYDPSKSVYEYERELNGSSKTFMKHISRNKHHPEYWRDVINGKAKLLDMPTKYFIEMIFDRIVQAKEMFGDSFTESSPYEYFVSHTQETAMPNILRQRTEKFLRLYEKLGEDKFLQNIKMLIHDPIHSQI